MAPEIYFDKRGELAIENIDELVERYPKWADRAINSALASEGFRLKGLIQQAIDSGGPENASWKKLHHTPSWCASVSAGHISARPS